MDELDVAGETSTGATNGHSGITLVLPSLRALKAANAGKKSKGKLPNADLDQRQKIPRPVKLKPLKEVLTKLINQIKKKDDYAFFIQPVDPAQVPGYADAIKNPMDFGTMTVKVSKGKYRSLEEFTSDFRLVTTNAKTFNPPGSIYHAEADRLEAWGLEFIARASAHVIEYETDWNIDIEQEDDGSTSQLPVNIDDEVSTPRDFDGSLATGSRAPSMTPALGQPPVHTGKRGPRGPYKKHAQTGLQEGLDAEGRMPGAKDGVGAFPVGSQWAELMVALKIKGKRYKTKKERLRFEKEGPPYHVDGSLDYAEMEDPFSVLSVFVSEPPCRPQVTPLYPPTSMPTTTDGSQPRLSIHPALPVTIPHNRPIPVLSTLLNTPAPSAPTTVTSTTPVPPSRKRRHWTVIRNAPARSRGKDKETDASAGDTKATWKVPRDAGPTDYGTFSAFPGELIPAAGPHSSATYPAEYVYDAEHRLFATIRSTIEYRGVKRKREEEGEVTQPGTIEEKESTETFWTDERAEEAWDYLRDIVYGGVDGYAYVRSLAEFVTPSPYFDKMSRDNDAYEDEEVDPADAPAEDVLTTLAYAREQTLPLGVPIARYIEDNLVDMVTRGRHGWLRDVLLPTLAYGQQSPFHTRLATLPGATRTMSVLKAQAAEQLDMAALIRQPEELAKEGTLEGDPSVGEERPDIERALTWGVEVIKMLDAQTSEADTTRVKEEVAEDEGHVKGVVDAMDVDLGGDDMHKAKTEPDADAEEAPLMKRLRMNLLALAKRAPLDMIAKLPAELVPENIRSIVPTA